MVATIRDIAAELDLSHTTVSRVLNGKQVQARVSPACAKRVRETAARLGYRRNTAARSMSTGRFNAVALVLSNAPHRSTLPSSLLAGIHDALAASGQRLLVSCLPDEWLTDERRAPSFLTELTCDGLLMNYHAHIPAQLEDLVDRCQLPAIWLNVKRKHDCVYPDDHAAVNRLTQNLLALGHRRILYADFSMTRASQTGTLHYSKVDRRDGYLAAMAAASLPSEVVLDPPEDEEIDSRNANACFPGLLAARLRQPDHPTAAVGYSDVETQICQRAAALAGLRVPEDFSVATVVSDEGWAAGLFGTAAILPERKMGRQAVQMLLERIAHPEKHLQPMVLPAIHEAGYSTAARQTGA